MNSGILDQIVGAFSIALDGAFGALQVYSIGLLSVLGLMYLLLSVGGMMSSGHRSLEVLGEFIWTVIKIGLMVFIMTVFYDLFWNGAVMTFLQWGLEGGGGLFSLAQFLQPSSIIDAGFIAAGPLYDFIHSFSGPGLLWNGGTVFTYLIAYWVIILAYAFIALHVIMTLIEIKLAIAVGAVLVPWGILSQTAVLAELSLSWITAGLVRILLTALLMSIGVPLFEILAFPGGSPLTGGPDPTLYQTITLALGSGVFAVLAWVLPSRAASIGGRGMALALGGDVLVGGGVAGVAGARNVVQLGQAAVRGTSNMIPHSWADPTRRAA